MEVKVNKSHEENLKASQSHAPPINLMEACAEEK